MGISYDPTIPSVGGDPNVEYNSIRTNFASIQTLIDVNHVDFGDATYGQHDKVDFPAVASPSAPSGSASVFYSGNIAGATSPYASRVGAFFKTSTSTVVCGFNAFCVFATNPATISSQFNVASVARNGAGDYSLTFNHALPSSSYGWQISINDANAAAYGIQVFTLNPTTFRFRIVLSSGGTSDPTNISVQLYGA